jgi:Domain of unknown function (DUF4476)
MKSRTLLLLFVLLIPVLSVAQQGGGYRRDDGYRNDEMSSLSIFSENGEQFFLVLNGINQNNVPTSKIRVDGLPKYDNDVEILFADNRTQAIRKRVNIADPVDGRAVDMILKIRRGRDGYAKLKFHKCTEVEHNYRAPQDEYYMTYGHPRQTTVTTTTTTRHEHDRYNNPPPAGPQAMDPATFEDVKKTISGSAFDDTKLSTAKTILSTNYVTTNQVMEICKLFSFEDNKLAFVKFAYNRTVDPNNYFKLGNVFVFSSNKEELNNFISSNPR